MGGFGSGRTSHRSKADQCRAVDVNFLNRKGYLRPGWIGSINWSRGDEDFGNITIRTDASSVIFEYRVSEHGGAWTSIRQSVPLTFADCHYGSQRPYFSCPGVVKGQQCNRRVAKLFCAGRYFLCRHCYNLGYTSQSQDRSSRLLSRANKTRKALGGEPGTASWVPDKPKWMHHKTYARLRAQIVRDESQADHLFLSKFARLFSREEREMYFER